MRDNQGKNIAHRRRNLFLGSNKTGRDLFSGEKFSQILGGLLVFFGLTQTLTILLGLGRVSMTARLGAVILIVSVLAGGLYGWWLNSARPGQDRRWRDRRAGGRVIFIILLLAGAWYLLLWILAYLVPDSSWDGLWYHNPTIHFWALRGRVHWIATDFCAYWTPIIDNYWNGYPKAVELFGFILVRTTGLDRLLNAVNLPWLPLGVFSIVSLSRTAGADIRWSVLAGALFLLVPVNISQAPTTYIDAATAAAFISCFAMTVLTISRIAPGVFPWKFLPALGCSLGLSLGVKGTGVAVVALSLALIALRMVGVSWRGSGSRSGGRAGLLFLLGAAATALVVGGYWYLRNFIQTGSPLHPVGLAIAGYRIFPGVLDPASLVVPPYAPGTEDWSQLSRVFFAWGQGLSIDNWKEAVISYTSRQGGVGYLWVLGCVPAIICLLAGAVVRQIKRSRPSADRGVSDRSLIWLSVMVLAAFLIVPRNHIARFSIWIYGLGLPAFAVAASRVAGIRSGFRRTVGKIWIAATLAVAVSEGIYAFGFQRGLDLPEYRRRGAESGLSIGRMVRGLGERYPVGYIWPRFSGSVMEKIITGRDPVALSEVTDETGKNRILGHLTQDQAFGKRPIYFLDREKVGNDPDRLRDFIESRRLRYVIWDTDVPIPRPLARRVDDWHRIDGLFYLLEFYPEGK